MNLPIVREFLDRDQNDLIEALEEEINSHVSGIHNEIYGYAIHAGVDFSVSDLVPVWNAESDILECNRSEVYYRYSVDEWQNWGRDNFPLSNQLIDRLNSEFDSIHQRADDTFLLDEFEIQHIENLHNSILSALLNCRQSGKLNSIEYLVIWIPDSNASITENSVRELNPTEIYRAFQSEFS